jgi:hypothetical protein
MRGHRCSKSVKYAANSTNFVSEEEQWSGQFMGNWQKNQQNVLLSVEFTSPSLQMPKILPIHPKLTIICSPLLVKVFTDSIKTFLVQVITRNSAALHSKFKCPNSMVNYSLLKSENKRELGQKTRVMKKKKGKPIRNDAN